jgi:hypothetical protein
MRHEFFIPICARAQPGMDVRVKVGAISKNRRGNNFKKNYSPFVFLAQI